MTVRRSSSTKACTPKVIGLAASPRRGGNSETLLDWFLEGASQVGAGVEKIVLPRLEVAPCTGCQQCQETGECIIQDDYQSARDRLLQADVVAIASPVYFWGLPSQSKAFVDRHQSLGAYKRIHNGLPPGLQREGQRMGALLGVAADPTPKFAALRQIAEAFLRTYGISRPEGLFVTGVFEKGGMQDRERDRNAALQLGQSMVKAFLSSIIG
jgi:multimeric flavodoxin WrbA